MNIAANSTDGSSPIAVLIAEDNKLNSILVAEQFRLLGIDAEIVPNGLAALARWRAGRFVAVLTDIQMPEMDGYELAESIRREEGEGPRIPIIALTANASQSRTARWRTAGIDACLAKPTELATLEALVERWKKQPRRDTAAPPAFAGASGGCEDAVDPRRLALVVGDDPQVLAELRVAFASSLKGAALGLERAITTRELVAARSIAHQLKSSAAAFGASALAGLAATMEDAAAGCTDCAANWQLLHAELLRVETWLAAHGISQCSATAERRDS